MHTMTVERHPYNALPLWMGLVTALAIALLFLGGQGTASAETAAKPIQVKLDEEVITFEKEPIKIKGTTLVQFRPLFEQLGMEVEWDSVNRVVTGTKSDLTIVLHIGSTTATVNGQKMELLQAPQIQNGHTLVPLRFVSEATNALVAWNPYMPQILIYTPDFMDANGVSRDQVQKLIDDELARIKAEYEADQEANKPPTPINVPAAPKGSGVYKPAASDKADLSKLQGMYYGLRDDYGGYECGGMCWDIYTFLPGGKVVIGTPNNGGPETIDCAKDECHSYTIKNGEMKLGNGEVYAIKVEDGQLVINDVPLSPVKPATDGMKLNQEYIYRGYWGLIGISSGSTSWSEVITFYDNGTFRSSKLMLGSVQGGAPTDGATGSDLAGSYRITGNTLVLVYSNGKVGNYLFFIHDSSQPGQMDEIQIGEDYFYVDED